MICFEIQPYYLFLCLWKALLVLLPFCLFCRLWSITTHRDHFVQRLSAWVCVCPIVKLSHSPLALPTQWVIGHDAGYTADSLLSNDYETNMTKRIKAVVLRCLRWKLTSIGLLKIFELLKRKIFKIFQDKTKGKLVVWNEMWLGEPVIKSLTSRNTTQNLPEQY